MSAKIAYFVHDLTDPAVHRRIRMLRAGDAAVTPIGFRRTAAPIPLVEGIPAVDLGRTIDGALSKRVMSVIAALTKLGRLEEHVRDADTLLARNLEMLLLVARARKRYAPGTRLVYECLDIHRMLVSERLDASLLRLLESRLLRDVDLLLTSSPAFVRNYFLPRGISAPIRIVENKLLALDDNNLGVNRMLRSVGPPWRIGWFGMIRCHRSLDILSSIAREADGLVEVVIRGRPSAAVFRNFSEVISAMTHVHYAGPYHPTDLSRIYGDVHFIWAIDYYESGQNSAWLLPNRIYEGCAYGSVPLALAGVETGAWLAKRSVGIVLDEPLKERLVKFFKTLDQRAYEKLAQAVDTLPRVEVVSDRADCSDLVHALCSSPRDPSNVSTTRGAQ
jgi:succinoglycan biosynthesis protein ExoL